ncbi:MAG: hypothetical protein PHN56_06735 [Candidatus Nanoarchaeia archaeon]|nr:hypothetical protein [Candidatus Nanoarchaeia archaeon]
MKKSFTMGLEKVIALIIVLVVIVIAIVFMAGDNGPLGWVKGIGSFMNSSTDYLTTK